MRSELGGRWSRGWTLLSCLLIAAGSGVAATPPETGRTPRATAAPRPVLELVGVVPAAPLTIDAAGTFRFERRLPTFTLTFRNIGDRPLDEPRILRCRLFGEGLQEDCLTRSLDNAPIAPGAAHRIELELFSWPLVADEPRILAGVITAREADGAPRCATFCTRFTGWDVTRAGPPPHAARPRFAACTPAQEPDAELCAAPPTR